MEDKNAFGLWRISDVSSYLKLPQSTIYKMTARKARIVIPHLRLGGRLRFRKADIDRWLELMTVSNISVLEQISADLRRTRNGIHS